MVEEDKSISLVPGVSEEEIGKKKSKTFYGISVIIIIILGIFYGLLWYYNYTILQEVKGVKGQIAAEQAKINAIKDVDKFLSFKKRLDTLDQILNERAVLWSSFLDELNKLTVTGVRYSSLSVSKEGVVSLVGEAVSAGDIARLLVSLKDTKENPTVFSDVKLNSGVSYGAEKVPFSLTLNLKKEFLRKK